MMQVSYSFHFIITYALVWRLRCQPLLAWPELRGCTRHEDSTYACKARPPRPAL